METRGQLAPETEEAAMEHYVRLGPTAQVVTKEIAKAMSFDAEEYEERVTAAVVETARDALFASLLEVHIGTRTEFENWLDGRDLDVIQVGSENVDHVVWHVAPFATVVAAATFHEEEQAAVATLRRQAFGRFYRTVVSSSSGESRAEEGASDA